MIDLELRRAKIEYAKRLQLQVYAKNPLIWLKERLGEDEHSIKWSLFGEGYETHQWDGTKDPLFDAWQSVANNKWVGVESATGTGKTYFLARLALWFLDTNPNSLVVTSAPKQDQLSLNLWKEIRSIFPKFQESRPFAEILSLRLKADKRKTEESGTDETDWHIIGFVAGVGANEESATKAQGFHRPRMLIITEETPGMSRAVMTAFKNTCTDPENNIIVAVGNPDSQVDVLHQFCKLDWVKPIRISAYDHPNVVLQQNVIRGAVTTQSIENRKKEYGEGSNMFLSRVRGISPEQAVDALVRLEWLQKAYLCEYAKDESSNAIGIDVANSENGDKASLAYGEANTLLALHSFQCPDASHLAYNLMLDDLDLATKHYHIYNTVKLSDLSIEEKNIGIDVVGVGASTIHTFQNEGINAVGLSGGQLESAIPKDEKDKPLFQFNSLRAQMYWELREDLRKGLINIAEKDNIVLANLEEELLLVKFVLKNGKIAVTKKEEIVKKLGRSPDSADALIYWNWVRKDYYLEKTFYVPYFIPE